MRALFSTTGGAGHLGPLLPFAGACRRAGHDVRIASQRAREPAVERAGFVPAPFDDPPEAAWAAARADLARLDAEKAGERVTDVFAGINARAALPGLLATFDAWRPDLVVIEPAEPAAALAAELHGIPVACVSFALAETAAWWMPFMAPAVDASRAQAGLPPDPDGERIRATPTLTATPAALDPHIKGPAPHRFRTEPAMTGAVPPSDWWPDDRDPLVYLTFGSVAASVGLLPTLYRAAIDALAPLPVRILLTTGNDADPAALGALPPNVHAERWVPQDDVLPHAAAMVGHGGYGTTLGALAHGVPQAFVPLFAYDQWINGRRVTELGAGLTLEGAPRLALQPPGEDVFAALPGTVERLLDEPSHRRSAERVAAEMAALPPVDEAVAVLEAIAAMPAEIAG